MSKQIPKQNEKKTLNNLLLFRHRPISARVVTRIYDSLYRRHAAHLNPSTTTKKKTKSNNPTLSTNNRKMKKKILERDSEK